MGAVIDLFSRRVVGWSMCETMTAQLVTDALERFPPILTHRDGGNFGPLQEGMAQELGLPPRRRGSIFQAMPTQQWAKRGPLRRS